MNDARDLHNEIQRKIIPMTNPWDERYIYLTWFSLIFMVSPPKIHIISSPGNGSWIIPPLGSISRYRYYQSHGCVMGIFSVASRWDRSLGAGILRVILAGGDFDDWLTGEDFMMLIGEIEMIERWGLLMVRIDDDDVVVDDDDDDDVVVVVVADFSCALSSYLFCRVHSKATTHSLVFARGAPGGPGPPGTSKNGKNGGEGFVEPW